MLLRSALSIVLLLAQVSSAFSQEESRSQSTAADHTAKAAAYDKMVTELRADIVAHQRMKAEFPRTVAFSTKGPAHPLIAKMTSHCDAAIREASVLIAEYEQLAAYHHFRAVEETGAIGESRREYATLANEYRTRSAEYRRQAAEHSAMREKHQPRGTLKGTSRDSADDKQMRDHCDRIIASATALANACEEVARLLEALADEQRDR